MYIYCRRRIQWNIIDTCYIHFNFEKQDFDKSTEFIGMRTVANVFSQ